MRQRGGAAGRALRRGGITIKLSDPALLDTNLHHFERAGNTREHVVEIVRQPAGELTDRLHLLALPKLFLHRHQVHRALLDLGFQRCVEIGQFLFDAAALGRTAHALRHFAHEGQFGLAPRSRMGVVEIEQGDEAALFGQRHVDERSCGNGFQRGGIVARPGIEAHVGDRHGLAGFECVDIGSIVAKLERAGDALHTRRVPVALDLDRLARRVDRAIAGAADTQCPRQ